MIQAELKGKLPDVENKEDILTSNVFGMLRYLPPQKGIFKILEAAKDYSERRSSFLENLKAQSIDLCDYNDVDYLFWENSPEYGEPDIVLIIKSSNGSHKQLMLCIEVKFLSEKSGIGEYDQLKAYTLSLADREKRKAFGNPKIARFDGIFLGTIYLTNYSQFRSVLDTLKEIGKTGYLGFESKIYELRWNEVTKTLLRFHSENEYENKLVNDLVLLLQKKNFVDFEGFTHVSFNVQYTPLFQPPLKIKESVRSAFMGFSDADSAEAFAFHKYIFLRCDNERKGRKHCKGI